MFFDHTVTFRITDVLELKRRETAHRTSARDIHVIGYRLSGSGELFCNGETFSVANGDILSIPPNIDYSQRTTGEHVIAIHLEIFGEKEDTMSVFTHPDPIEADRFFLNILQIWAERADGYRYRAMAALAEFLAEIQHLHVKKTATPSKIADSIRYIKQNFTNPQLTVADIARHSNFSEVHFRRLFIDAYGNSPLTYITDCRIAFACRLLRSGGFSIAEISEKTGFSDPKYFSTCFKKHTGYSPSQYVEQTAWRTKTK